MTTTAKQLPRYYNLIFREKEKEKNSPLGLKTNEIYEVPEGSETFVVHQIFKLDEKDDTFKDSTIVTFNITFYDEQNNTTTLFEKLTKKSYTVPKSSKKYKIDQIFKKQAEEDDSEWNTSEMSDDEYDTDEEFNTDDPISSSNDEDQELTCSDEDCEDESKTKEK